MKQAIRSFVIFFACLFFWSVSAQAGEQQALAEWIQNNAAKKVKLSSQEAMSYVKAAYATGEKYRIDPLLLLAKMYAESNFRAKVVSSYGAVGLMQVVPRYHKEKIQGRNIRNPAVNIDVGGWILNEYMEANDNNYKAAMVKYTGGARSAHNVRVKKAHRALVEAILSWRMAHDKPIERIAVYGDPRAFYEHDATETVAAHPPKPPTAPLLAEKTEKLDKLLAAL